MTNGGMVLLSCLIILLPLLSAGSITQGSQNCNRRDTDYDHLVLAQWWPASSPRNHAGTTFNTENSWGIHGLWPSREDKKFVENKNPWTSLSPNLYDKNLQESFQKYWSYPKGNCWEYQWNKHGRCGLNTDWGNPADYFRKTLDLRNACNIGRILLQGAQISPQNGRKVSLKKISAAIQSQCRVNKFSMLCHKDRNDPQKHLLFEVRLCVSKSPHNIKDCKSHFTNCTADVYYPEGRVAPIGGRG